MHKILQKMLRAIVHPSLVKVNILAMIKFLPILALMIHSCNQYYEGESLLIPDKSIGWYFIIYEQTKFPTPIQSGRRVYKLTNDRFFFTNQQPNHGIISSNDSTITAYYCDSQYQPLRQLPVYIHADSLFMDRFRDSIMVFPSPPHGKGKYKIYPICIDTLKNIYNYDHAMIPITEAMIDSILLNK
jgi:hypothetical protein